MFGKRIGRHLLKSQRLTAEQLEEARRTRSFFGGDLGTHLLRLGFVDEETLGEALSELTGAPYASTKELRSLPPETLGVFPGELVERHRVCPFALEGNTLRVAMINPRDAVAVAALKAATRYDVEPWVTSEYRLELALERHFGIRPEGRKGLQVGPSSDPTAAGRPSPAPAWLAKDAGDGEAPGNEPAVGLDGLPLDAEVAYDDHLFTRWPVDPLDAETEPRAGEDGETSLEALGERLNEAEDTGEIADALLAYCGASSPRCAVFTAGSEGVQCLAARGRGLEEAHAANTTLPVGLGTVFDGVLETGRFHLGPVPPLPGNREVFALLGGEPPPMTMILPVVVRGRRVALLYLDSDRKPTPVPDVAIMRRVAAMAGLALEILLLKRKLREI